MNQKFESKFHMIQVFRQGLFSSSFRDNMSYAAVVSGTPTSYSILGSDNRKVSGSCPRNALGLDKEKACQTT